MPLAPEVVNDNKPVSTASPRKFKSKSNDWFQHDEKRVPEPITTGMYQQLILPLDRMSLKMLKGLFHPAFLARLVS